MSNGTFIMIDGIAGSGKTTVIQAMFEALVAQGLRCVRLQDWRENHPPTMDELQDFDVLFSFEPTKSWVGSALRSEMFHTPAYSGVSHAHAFALDREIQYRRLILPALEAGKIVIQDRGVSSSLVYQPILPNTLSVEEIATLPGNQLALKHAPDHLILTRIAPEQIVERIAKRNDDSKGMYGELELMRKVDARFREPWFRAYFETHGTRIHTLDTGGTLSDSQTRAITLITKLVTSEIPVK